MAGNPVQQPVPPTATFNWAALLQTLTHTFGNQVAPHLHHLLPPQYLQQPPQSIVSRSTSAFRSSWVQNKRNATIEAIRQALEHQANLQKACSELSGHVSAMPSEAQDAFMTMQASSIGLQDFLSSMTAPVFFNEKRSIATAATSEGPNVFRIPELLESILMFLEAKDILSMLSVSKPIRNIVEDSPKLQRQLGLCADTESFFRSPLPFGANEAKHPAYPGFRCKYLEPVVPVPATTPSFPLHGNRSARVDPGNNRQIHVKISFRPDARGRLPVVGERYRNMLICQPPIFKMVIKPICCELGAAQPGEEIKHEMVKSAKGLTIGDLWDSANTMIKKHELCPNAPPHLLDDKGYVKVRVDFTVKYKLREDDPIWKRHKELVEKQTAKRDADQAALNHLQAYTMAKRAAHAADEPIPSLAEFEAGLEDDTGGETAV